MVQLFPLIRSEGRCKPFRRDPHFWKEIHGSLMGLLVALALVDFGGVLAPSDAHKENWIRAMITGRKKARRTTAR